MANDREVKDNILANLATYVQITDQLKSYGLLEFMQNRALPRTPYSDSANFNSHCIQEIGRVQGYNEAIKDLFEFKESYLMLDSAHKDLSRSTPTFGGLKMAVDTKNLTPEEASKLKSKKALIKEW